MIDTDDAIGCHGKTLVATWPGPEYGIQRIALERASNIVYLVADGRILERFAVPDFGAAWAAFADLDPLPLATLADAQSAPELGAR